MYIVRVRISVCSYVLKTNFSNRLQNMVWLKRVYDTDFVVLRFNVGT